MKATKKRSRWIGASIVMGTIVACSFSNTARSIDGGIDPTGPCTGETRECAAGMVRVCTGTGADPMLTPCPIDCTTMGGSAHCALIDPYGGGATSADTDPATFGALIDVVIVGPTTINGSLGTITGLTTGFDHRLQNGIAVFRFKSLRIDANVKLAGSAAIVLVADGVIELNANIDARGTCGLNMDAAIAGPGGFDGARAESANGSGGSAGGRGAIDGAGAGGGGHGGSGGRGGDKAALAIGAMGGASFGTPTIDLLVGGGGGGATEGAGGRGHGGGGGGAIQLVSNVKILFGAAGTIDAGGCGGDSGQSNGGDGGGGGGAGGAILLEAPTIEGAGRLAVNGGGGGAGDDGGSAKGADGTLGRLQAAGATGVVTAGGPGGNGAAGTFFNGEAAALDAMHAGGGGGAIGRIRLNTRSGNVDSTAEMSPHYNDPGSTCTTGTLRLK